MIDLVAVLRNKINEGNRSMEQSIPVMETANVDLVHCINNKLNEQKNAEHQKQFEMPRANLDVTKVDRLKQFIADRSYDDAEFKLDNPLSMRTIQEIIRKEQSEEYLHNDDNRKTFNVINETNNQHPYDAFFQRKPKDE